MYHLSAFKAEGSSAGDRDENWQQTAWGRIFAGLLLAQGLGYATQHLFTAGFLAGDDAIQFQWATPGGLFLLFVLQSLSLMVGAGLAGAGQHQGVLHGGLIGLLHGLIFILLQRQTNELLPEFLVYAQPIVFAGVGALGGKVGAFIWKPAPLLLLGGPVPEGPAKFSWSEFSPLHYFEGPVHFGRVCAGILVVVLGVFWSKVILHFFVEASGGSFAFRTHFHERLMLMEVIALATLAGSALAGATTFNGLKQGLCVGLGASIILGGMEFGNPKGNLESTVFLMISTIFLTLVGGWFGAQLFPPVCTHRRRNVYEVFPHRW